MGGGGGAQLQGLVLNWAKAGRLIKILHESPEQERIHHRMFQAGLRTGLMTNISVFTFYTSN